MATWRRVAATAGASLGIGALAAGLGTLSVASYFARKVVTPDRTRPADAKILEVRADQDGRVTAAVMSPSLESLAPGRYSLYWDAEAGHAQMGDVLGRDPSGNVIREVLRVTRGQLHPGPARWSGSFYDGNPSEAFGYPTHTVDLPSEFGINPAWVTPAGSGEHWAVLVHGRGASRMETLRAVPILHGLGITTLIPSYRNDDDGSPSTDGRYSLGLTEWVDVETAITYAFDQGATRVDLFGWSMGGAIVMQVLDRCAVADRIGKVVLDSPVLDWGDVMAHHASLNGLHPHLADFAAWLLRHGSSSTGLIGLAAPIDLQLTNWVARSQEIRHPMLVIHSIDDAFVPFGPSARVAQLRPDLVTLARWERAGHVREWNTDPKRWERVVTNYLAAE